MLVFDKRSRRQGGRWGHHQGGNYQQGGCQQGRHWGYQQGGYQQGGHWGYQQGGHWDYHYKAPSAASCVL